MSQVRAWESGGMDEMGRDDEKLRTDREGRGGGMNGQVGDVVESCLLRGPGASNRDWR